MTQETGKAPTRRATVGMAAGTLAAMATSRPALAQDPGVAVDLYTQYLAAERGLVAEGGAA